MKVKASKFVYLQKIVFLVLAFFVLNHELFVEGTYETKGYPLIHLSNNNENIGSVNNLVKNNLINVLSLYENVKIEGNEAAIDNIAKLEDETKVESIIKGKIQYINKNANSKYMIKYSGFINLYEMIHDHNIYFLIHFLTKNMSGGLVIILPENLYIDRNEYFKINNLEPKKFANVTNDVLEKRILFAQKVLLNLKLNQAIYFVINNKEVEGIYKNYTSKFSIFDLTRNVSVVPVSNAMSIKKLNAKSLYYFLSNDSININTIFNQKQSDEIFLLTKKKTIVITLDYNVFNVISDFASHTTSKNSGIILMNELISLFTQVYKKEDINYNILFFFSNYYYGIDNFIDSLNQVFKENIEFVICLDDFNEANAFLHQADQAKKQNYLSRFYDILKKKIQSNFKTELKIKKNKIKINNKHLPNIHEYFVLKNLNSFTLSSKNNNSTFLAKTPLLENKLKTDNIRKHAKALFEALYTYIKPNMKPSENEKEIEYNTTTYTNNIKNNEEINTIDHNLNKYNKFFLYKDDIVKLFNYIKTLINPQDTNNNYLVTDFIIPVDKTLKYTYQTHSKITFYMVISYLFHYIHFIIVGILTYILYIFIKYQNPK
ncbi:conserved Plasmodium protein, unknown function [Plasmodium chabaudi adami]|uniref:Nicalin n=1 Tax=Plasmodium chabaudi adami TaxID=5826 RepID=A0A1C6YI81_PLACE|nr:conserved Plasmodium protein, unknown function [Plasmodium chabaudi adami]